MLTRIELTNAERLNAQPRPSAARSRTSTAGLTPRRERRANRRSQGFGPPSPGQRVPFSEPKGCHLLHVGPRGRDPRSCSSSTGPARWRVRSVDASWNSPVSRGVLVPAAPSGRLGITAAVIWTVCGRSHWYAKGVSPSRARSLSRWHVGRMSSVKESTVMRKEVLPPRRDTSSAVEQVASRFKGVSSARDAAGRRRTAASRAWRRAPGRGSASSEGRYLGGA
jgi:hypothetical protein